MRHNHEKGNCRRTLAPRDFPTTLLHAAKLVERDVDGVDLNLGCPQPIAQKGNFGAYLMRQPDTVTGIVATWSRSLSVPVTCKVRLLDEKSKNVDERGLQGTINFCRALEVAGASAICVHGRTRSQKGFRTGRADWQAIAAVKAAVTVPVIANGGIETHEDVRACLAATGCDAVMSAEALLECPALFNAHARLDHDYRLGVVPPPEPDVSHWTPTTFARAYLDLVGRHPPSDFFKCVKSHVMKLCHRPAALAASTRLEECVVGNQSEPNSSATEAAAGLEARDALLGASNMDELAAAVELLDAFMQLRAAHLPPAQNRCKFCPDSNQREGCTDENVEGQTSVVSEHECRCWRSETWYRRHRRSEQAQAATQNGDEVAAARQKRKDDRRERFLAMGYDLSSS